MTGALLSALAVVVLWLVFLGWGSIIAAAAGMADESSQSLQVAWGMAGLVAVGGALNLCGLLFSTVLWSITVVGLILAALQSWRLRLIESRTTRDRDFLLSDPVAIGIVLLVSLILVQSAISRVGTLWPETFNTHDDFHAYLAFPMEMLQRGSLVDDPFCARRAQNGLGGQSFLLAMTSLLVPMERLNVLERAFGPLLLILLVAGHGRRLGLQPRPTAGLLLLVSVIPWPMVNTSSLTSSAALFYALVLTVDAVLHGRFVAPSAVKFAVIPALCACLTAVKTSNLVGVSAVMTAFFVCAAVALPFRQATVQLAGITSASALLFAPWSYSLYRSSGTLFFPMLGRGLHGSNYGSAYLPGSAIQLKESLHILVAYFSSDLAPALLLLLFALAVSFASLQEHRSEVLWLGALAIGSLVGGGLTAILGNGAQRFGYGFLVPIVLYILVYVLGSHRAPIKIARYHTVAIAASWLLVGAWLPALREKVLLERFVMMNPPRYEFAGSAVALREAQYVVPAGEIILTHLSRPFLLDFRRNPIYLTDQPGEMSPPPGLPLHGDAIAMRGYLLRNGVRFVMFGYGDEAGFSHAKYGALLNSQDPWTRSTVANTFLFHDRIQELGHYIVYDDGSVIVLDLLSSRLSGPAHPP